MSTLGENNCSQFYDNVIRELSMIVNNEKIISHNNHVLALEIKLYYVMKSSKYNSTQKDEILKRMIIERTKALEYKITELIKRIFTGLSKNLSKTIRFKICLYFNIKKGKIFCPITLW
ncbi:hypothetical protein SKUN_00710 [Spiroplasma kunkelii CR2-3x]|uniref:Uncharacterized protein n=1 Tax=Spiroplasma kunkelii CR2-3x TaxID=273035 RepID=A0A0K2JGP5_SPIKU|nr:hypothetical protein [Spiroplasma kunkelii]ALA97602.1 hypothetical protein SKUN_00710 [Spiroplasma kunkelii CR2-3x]